MEIKDILSPAVTIIIAAFQLIWFNKWFEKKKLMLSEQSKTNFMLYNVHVSIYQRIIEMQVEFDKKINSLSNETYLRNKISEIRKFIGMNSIHLTISEISELTAILELFDSCFWHRDINTRKIIQNDITLKLYEYQNSVKQQYLSHRKEQID